MTVVSLEGGKRDDAQFANDLADKVREACVPISALMEEARREDMQISFSIAPDSFGRFVPTVHVVKLLA